MMTPKQHLAHIAQKYAEALVQYHMDKTEENFDNICDWQNLLNEVAEEIAEETLEA